jgi:predicted dehydrogenase
MRPTALVVGMGAIGRRHARLLDNLDLDVAVVSRHAADAARRYPSLDAALRREHPSYVVVANETAAHLPTLTLLAEGDYAGTVLVEKPLFDRPAPLPRHRFAGFYVGYNLRFHPVLREVARLLVDDPAISAQVYVGQYLPDWRPDRDYRETSSASRAAGGGALRDLSHELDYMSWLFGPCRRVTALGGRFSPLAIDSDDVQALLLSFARCPVATAQLNYLDRPGGRTITINTASRTIRADLRRGILQIDAEAERQFPIGRDETYLAQHREALGGDNRDTLCTAAEGAAVLDLVAAAEQAGAAGRWVEL